MFTCFVLKRSKAKHNVSLSVVVCTQPVPTGVTIVFDAEILAL